MSLKLIAMEEERKEEEEEEMEEEKWGLVEGKI